MIQLLVGEKGSGKTKVLLEKANEAAASAQGNIVFIDKDNSHMYELKNNIRLVNVSEYDIEGAAQFAGFIAGIVSADHDLEQIFVDRFAKIAGDDFEDAIVKVNALTEKYNIKCTASVSVAKDALSDAVSAMVTD